MTLSRTISLLAGPVLALFVTSHVALAQGKGQPFGGDADVAFAGQLWTAMKEANLVGVDRIVSRPFQGNEPHGSIQQVLDTRISVGGEAGRVIVKANHGGEEAGVDTVHRNPNKFLAAYTVMFKKPEGYDPENQNWFWVKYTTDGQLDTNPKGMKLAGRVAKGTNQGCIACHRAMGGDDLEILRK
ncbi:MAG: hypothetical protein KKB37_05035 [Alphaproteobacteria bacterium]|nr:hypothetical protein [Alphaproteobacteria bacterium]